MIFILKLTFIFLIYIIHDAESQILHYGDYIEFSSALKYCHKKVFTEQIRKFGRCLQDFSRPKADISQPKEIAMLCKHERRYESCWDPVIQKSMECNAASGQGTTPKIYMGVIRAVCRDDNGHGYIERLKKEIKHVEENGHGESDCNQIGNWQNVCKHLENEMNSHDTCTHAAYYKCLYNMKCQDLSRAEWSLSIYHLAGYALGCKYDQLNEVENTFRDKRMPWNHHQINHQQVNHQHVNHQQINRHQVTNRQVNWLNYIM